MLWAEIDWDICRGCEPCLARRACKMHAIMKFERGEPSIVDQYRCFGCGVCIRACVFSAVVMKGIHRQDPQKPENGAEQA